MLPRSSSTEAPTTTQAATTRIIVKQTTNANYELEDGIEDITGNFLFRTSSNVAIMGATLITEKMMKKWNKNQTKVDMQGYGSREE